MRDRARTVVVGAGIVGASAAYHLAELGEPDVLVLDQGPLFETGGSSSHAPGLAFQTNGSRMMCRIAQESVALYATLDVDGEPGWYGVGGIEVATTAARMQELKRRLGFARSYGLEGAELLTPAETAEKIPLLDPSTILGAYHVPSDGIAKAVTIATALARRAEANGVAFEGGVTVTGFDVRDGRVHGVRTDRGNVECERVLLCAGIWGPTVGAMAGVPIPLVAVQHQLVWTDPVAGLEGETREVAHPILRHQDMAMYFRHRQDHYAVGSYRHEPIVTTPGGAAPAGRRPDALADAVHARRLRRRRGRGRTPAAGARGADAAGRPRALDQRDVLVHAGRGLDRRGIGGGSGRVDLRGRVGDARRRVRQARRRVDRERRALDRHGRGRRQPLLPVHDDAALRARAREAAVPGGVRHPPSAPADGAPSEAPPDARSTRGTRELGAEFVTGAGWERPEWFEANAGLVPSDAPWASRDGWAAQLWSPIEGAEHLATRSNAALFDLTPFAKFDVEGPDALAYLERICANRIDRPVGAIVYTALLTSGGGIRCDLTIARKSEELFRVVTGGGSGQHDLAWMRRQIGESERVRITERTGSLFALGLWGPKAREILGVVTDADLGNDAFPYMTARYLHVGEVGPVWAQRISYAGELGWELYGQFAMGDRAWELLWEAGREHGLVAAGLGAFDTLRLEKGYRLWGQDIDTEHDPFEAGLGFAVKMDKATFQGRDALTEIIERGPTRRLACIALDDPSAVVLGKEPIRSDGRVVGYATSAGYGYSVGRCIVYGYLPVELAVPGSPVEVEYFDERLPATVAEDPLWDPKGERLRA